MRRFAVVSLLVIQLAYCANAQNQLQVQLQVTQRGQTQEKEESLVYAPRELQQKLKQCRTSIQMEEYDIGLPLLRELMSVESDSFVKGENAGLRALAIRELKNLPTAGFESLELRFGNEASAALALSLIHI